MQHEVRAAIAAASFAVLTGQTVGRVVDHRDGQSLPVTARAEGDAVEAYDFRRGGALSGTLPGLFDHAGGTHVDLKRVEDRIEGFHYASGGFFRVVAKGRLAEMFDFADQSWSAFTMG